MKPYKLIITVLCLCGCIATQVNAQITVGANSDPAPYSIVEVVGDKGGVRLPRMTATEMNELASTTLPGEVEAEGLVVYNITDNRLEFWNGSRWIALSGLLQAENGLTYTTTPTPLLELGGELSKNTQIEHNGNDLNFLQGNNAEFTTGILSVKNQEISLAPPSGGQVTVNTNALAVSGADNSIEIRAENININNNLLSVEKSAAAPGISIEGTLQYKDGNESAGYILASDANGNVAWEGIRPFGTVIEGKLDDTIEFDSGAGFDVTVKQLDLQPGQWMILAKATIKSTGVRNESTSLMYYWMTLLAGNQQYAKTGINPEMITNSRTAVVYAAPSLIHYVNITSPTKFKIVIDSSNARGNMTTDHGGSYFYAVRLDMAN